MSKLLPKEHSPLKFDTSSANLDCFIDNQSKHKRLSQDCHSRKNKNRKKARGQYQKHVEFQEKAFLESIVSKILTDSDCPGITELIDNMVFPTSNSAEAETNKDHRRQQLQQQEISQIFSNFQTFNNLNYNQKLNIYHQNNEHYRILPPHLHFINQEKLDVATTLHSSYANSYPISPREVNPEVQIGSTISSNPTFGYPYPYYAHPSYMYARQPQRKRKAAPGDENQQFRIIPNKIEADGRTTLMIRHIPNKYSQDMLLQEIGKSHRLHINFLYLPIDHYNSCNVGYAFANFIHAKFILEFYNEFKGRRWDRFNSEKICQLAYARIQGTTNLMDHFQNSSSSQVRNRGLGKNQLRKKSSFQLNQEAIIDINSIVKNQKDEEK